MTDKQWNEFLDKLDFVELTERWNLLPLHWLDDEPPASLSDSAKHLVAELLEARAVDDEKAREEIVREASSRYRERLSHQAVTLDSRLTPPGSRVTLSFMNLNQLGEGDCLIATGAWDRVGYRIAEAAHPGGEHIEKVGDNPVRTEPGKLNFRHLLLFPDKGTPSPRSFRSLCEKTLRQARGLGARSISMAHLHLPQTGLADRFAAAEVVSAIRQMLRESPGVTVDILAFTHRNFEDYDHWFESLKSLMKAEEPETETEPQPTDTTDPDASSYEVSETLRNLARRSSDFASEATASVRNWFAKADKEAEPESKPALASFDFSQRQILNSLYFKRPVQEREWSPEQPEQHYLQCLIETIRCESGESDAAQLLPTLQEAWRMLGPHHPLHRYYRLLAFRLQSPVDSGFLESLLKEARDWEDLPLVGFLHRIGEDTSDDPANRPLAPVYPAGSRTSALSSANWERKEQL